MENIWGFALQTLSVTVSAGLLLLIKTLLKDKLSPRWQYGVWCILAIRCLVPVQIRSTLFPTLALWLEAGKSTAEKLMHSAYTAAREPISSAHVFPWITQRPFSLTDWLMILYLAGILFFLFRYLMGYLRLRMLLKKGEAPDPELEQRLLALCEKFHLKPCRAVVLEGLESAFVCGIWRPVLAVPGNETDEKILLHELLHLRYLDIPQGILWAVLRALHWCNPAMQLIFDRIGNDMESLCDQRVLERLEGEERREYGTILLEMATRRYPRAPGTSSLSNGSKNIARRIAAIVRFKKYPKGMALVSVCIGAMLFFPLLTGRSAVFGADRYQPEPGQMELSMAAARISRCTTPAGALDTYARGLITGNGIYLATASPLSAHEALEREMAQNAKEGADSYRIYAYDRLGNIDPWEGYQVLDLRKTAAGYRCYLTFSVPGEEENTCVALPVILYREQGWVIQQNGEPVYSESTSELPATCIFTGRGESGTVTVTLRTEMTMNNQDQISVTAPSLDAEFDQVMIWENAEYRCSGGAQHSVGMKLAALDSPESRPEFPEVTLSPGSGGSHSDGFSWTTEAISEDWDGTLTCGGGGGYSGYDMEDLPLPAAYLVQIYWDGALKEELMLT